MAPTGLAGPAETTEWDGWPREDDDRPWGSGLLRLGLRVVLPPVDLVVGLVGFVVTVPLLALSVGLVPLIWLALPFFLLLGVVARGLAGFERHRLGLFLGVELGPSPAAPRGFRARLRDATTWRAVAYLLVRWVVATLSFALTMSAWGVSLALLSMPAWLHRVPGQRANLFLLHVTDTPTAWLLCVAGLVVGIVGLALAYGFGAAAAAMSRGLLSGQGRRDGRGEALAGAGHPGGAPMRLTAGRAAVLAVGLPVVLAVASFNAADFVGLMAQTSAHHTARYSWNGGPITLTTSAGDIHVVTGDDTQVGVAYTEHYALRTPAVAGEATADGGVALTAHCRGGIFDQCAVNYALTVPRGARLTLRTGDGSVDVSGVAGPVSLRTGGGSVRVTDTTGPVTARTGDGGIDVSRSSGSLDLRTGNGGITGGDLTSPSATVRTGDGRIALTFDTAPSDVSATTGDGGIIIALPEDGPYRVDATTGDGRTRVTVPTAPSAPRTIHAHSGDGTVTVAPTRR
ncbi:sensor domain-containing protein [Pseudofrankia sp. BMG5.36]|uniref:sensor domain-containing protein n=1 Tax=Pseudofrankia sp. BMG5.36 TaxID=1834512 RepID=UPI0018E345F7|nr:sensor domain-containing protein [Pseudofrankia sp. BMG5.36]